MPAALGVRAADPIREIVALSGDYDFQFLIEELAVGAQFKLPYIHVVVNNSYLGLIRQAQRGFEMDYQVQLSFENINAPELGVYGVDHVAVAEGLGCKAIRVTDPHDAQAAFATAREWMAENQVPVVVEFILERVTNIAMGTEIDNIVEFEEVLDLPLDDAPVGRPGCSRQTAGGKLRGYRPCRNLPPISRCCSARCRSSIALPRPRPPASAASNICSPMISKGRAARAIAAARLDPGAAQSSCRQLGAPASAASPSCRTGSMNSATACTRAIDYAKALDCRQVNCLVGIAPAGADAAELNEVLVEESAVRRGCTGAGASGC